MSPTTLNSGNPAARIRRIAAGTIPAAVFVLLTGCGEPDAASPRGQAQSASPEVPERVATVPLAEVATAPVPLAESANRDRPSRSDAPYASPFVPPPYSGIYPEEFEALLTGEFVFEPDPIPDDGVPVGNAPLNPGEVLQVRSGGLWWAGIVLEIQAAGEVLIGYFGWDESHDEWRDRLDLKFNPEAARAAVNTKYWPLVF